MTQDMRWNTPPGWPEPPPGWRPEPGWQPDPAWPPAPEGWQFWTSSSAALAPAAPQVKKGFFARRRESKEQEERAALIHAWLAHDARLSDMIEFAEAYPEQFPTSAEGIMLKAGERLTLNAAPVALVEPRRAPGHFQAGTVGVSFRVMKGVTVRTGSTRGTYVQGVERPTPIDQGRVVITDRRVIFQGPKQSREWAFDKLLGYHHDEAANLTFLQVSNRQKVSGLMYGDDLEPEIHFRLALAVAGFRHEVPTLIETLRADQAAHRANRPQPL